LVACGRACQAWSAGAPTTNLLRVAQHVENRTDAILKLLVEIAQTATRRSVPVRGLRNGLRRAATQLQHLHDEVLQGAAQLVAGVLPKEPKGLPQPAQGIHPIERAWSDGDLNQALSWIREQPPNATGLMVELLLEQSTQPPTLDGAKRLHAEGMTQIRARRFGQASVLLTMSANSYLWCGHYQEALSIAVPLRKTAGRARHGMGVASATLIIMEAFLGLKQPTLATIAHREGGIIAYRMGAYAALDRLARWREPEEDALD